MIPIIDDSAQVQSQKRIGRRLRQFVRVVGAVVRGVVDTVRTVVGAAANLILPSTTVHIVTSVNSRTDAPLVRAWDDGLGGYGQPLVLKGLRVNVSGPSGLTLYKAQLDNAGKASVKVPKNIKVRVCFETDSPAAHFESGIILPALHCWQPQDPTNDANFNKPVGDLEFYDMALLIDAREYATKVLGFTPPKATIQTGFLAQVLTSGGAAPAYTPCLAGTNAPIAVINVFGDAVHTLFPIAGAFLETLEFAESTDIILSRAARGSRDTAVHEYGHYFFCTLLADTRINTYSTVWSAVLTPQNLPADSTTEVKALNEGIADWFASQVTGSTNYFATSLGRNEGGSNGHYFYGTRHDFDAPRKATAFGGGTEANIGGPDCPAGLDTDDVHTGCISTSGWKNTSDANLATARVVGTVTTILHDAIDRADCGTDATCLSALRNDAAPWNIPAAANTRFTVQKPFRLDDIGDERIALTPAQLKQGFVDFANANGVAGTALNYTNFYGALAGRMTKSNYSYNDVCNLFRIHSTAGECGAVTPPAAGGDPNVFVGFSAKPSNEGSVQAFAVRPNACTGGACTVQPGTNVILVATPTPGFNFKGWSNCSTSTFPTLYLTNVTANATCVANFAPTVTLSYGETTGGTASPTGLFANVCDTDAETCSFLLSGVVTLTETPDAGFQFVNWSGTATGCSGTNSSLTLLVTKDETCTANFAALPAPPTTFTVTASAGTGGTVSPTRTTVTKNGSVTLSATASSGFRFGSWSGGIGCTGTNTRLVVSNVTADVACVAAFIKTPKVTFAVDNILLGANASAVTLPGGAACSGGACTVDAGGSVALTATAIAPFQSIANWKCTESTTGTVRTSTSSDPTHLTLTNIQNNWSCTAITQLFQLQ